MTTTLFASHDSSTFVNAATPAAWLTDDAQLVIWLKVKRSLK